MLLSCDFLLIFLWGKRRDQTLWLILTHDGSKCAESRKDVPFGVIIFNFNTWPYLPPKISNFDPNSNFKPKWWNMKIQVYQKLLNQWTWKFDTILRTWNSVLRCNMMTSQQSQCGGRPPYWKSYFGYISAIYCLINAKFRTLKQNHVQAQVKWPN